MKSLVDKIAVITGAGSGIGRELALALAAEGSYLALSDIDSEGLAETASRLPEGKCKTYPLDVTDRDAVFAHAQQVQNDYGSAHLLFNNAGTTLVGLLENQTLDEMRWLINVNMWGVIYGCKAFLPMMLAQREGVIVNLSSVLGLVSLPTHSAYSISKYAVRGLTESLWSELAGTGVRAVCVHPGGIDTGFDQRARMAASGGEREQSFLLKAARTMSTTPRQCAKEILGGVRRGNRRIVTGRMSGVMSWLPRLFPSTYHRFLKSVIA